MKRITGRLAEKAGKWYAVINLYTTEGKRKEKEDALSHMREDLEEAYAQAKKEAEDRITEAVREAAEEMGYEVTVKDEPGGDTFESLFGVSVEDLKKMADTEGNEETK